MSGVRGSTKDPTSFTKANWRRLGELVSPVTAWNIDVSCKLGGSWGPQKLPEASQSVYNEPWMVPIGSHSCQFFPCQCLVIIIEFLEERQPGMDPELATGLILRLRGITLPAMPAMPALTSAPSCVKFWPSA